MKMMTCPVNGDRAISEFSYGGPVIAMPDPDEVDDAVWGDYVYHRSSVPGIQQEWWCHIPSTTWFIAERDTERDVIRTTYLYSRPEGYSRPEEER